jgi:hypothetical protein
MKNLERTRASVLVAFLAIGVAGLGVSLNGLQEQPFPHSDHQGLFPLCTGCHEGIPLGDASDWYPEPASCEGCHDGEERARVSWSGPEQRIDNLEFEHQAHAQELEREGDPEQDCSACHIPAGEGRMFVSDSIQVATCWGCPAPETDDHYDVDQQCESCHVPLARTDFELERIEALPIPASHESELFLSEDHGRIVAGRSDRCATCHVQDKCVSCHVTPDLDPIVALPFAPEGMELPAMEAEYPEPGSHLDEGWIDAHQVQAAPERCNSCHTTDDCRTCHIAIVPAIVEALPERANTVAPGVMLEPRSPDTHESVFFMEAHPTLAASDDRSCATCHVETFCVECHDAAPGGGYHPGGFVARHSAEAFGREAECADCHSPQLFCRECHSEAGLTSSGRLGSGYHNGGGVWLLRHGQAARQGLESCTSCHKQRDCVQCHGVLGAFKVSPHGPDFDAERAWSRSARTCLACHVRNPLNGGEP